MNNQPLAHDDASALMTGSLPEDRSDLVVLAAAIDDFRDAFLEPAPQPSPALMGWLIGAPAHTLHGTDSAPAAASLLMRTSARIRMRTRAAASALTGLGLAAKIALGGTAVLAAVSAAGAVGVLPEKPQAVFDRIVGDHADAPPPRTPLAETTGPDARPDADADAGSAEQRLGAQGDTSERQPRDSGDQPENATSDPPHSVRDPLPGQDGSDDPDDPDNEGHEETDDEPRDRSDNEPDEESDRESDRESGEGPDDDTRADDTEESDDASDNAADADRASDSSDDQDSVQAETDEGNFD